MLAVTDPDISDRMMLVLSVVMKEQSPSDETTNGIPISDGLSAVNNIVNVSCAPADRVEEYLLFITVTADAGPITRIRINKKLKNSGGFFMAIANLYARARVHDIFSV